MKYLGTMPKFNILSLLMKTMGTFPVSNANFEDRKILKTVLAKKN